MRLPKDKLSPTLCKGGWFYVNRGSIDTVAEVHGNNIVTLYRPQLEAALKIMKRSGRNTGSEHD
jgi:hypothetical protein